MCERLEANVQSSVACTYYVERAPVGGRGPRGAGPRARSPRTARAARAALPRHHTVTTLSRLLVTQYD